jgi:hypothetical protein
MLSVRPQTCSDFKLNMGELRMRRSSMSKTKRKFIVLSMQPASFANILTYDSNFPIYSCSGNRPINQGKR